MHPGSSMPLPGASHHPHCPQEIVRVDEGAAYSEGRATPAPPPAGRPLPGDLSWFQPSCSQVHPVDERAEATVSPLTRAHREDIPG